MTAKSLFLNLLVLAAVILPYKAAANADAWKYLTSTENGVRCFYNAPSVIVVSKDVFQVRTRKIGADGSTTSGLEEINCAYKIFRERESTIDLPNKPPQVSHDDVTNWRPMELDPFMSQLFKAVCR